mmetsp:Transcript_39701/g.63074  ORF Transcript_39701/g.63074 Transcript_39701/m.63074 type:complete len:293 (+) Transcript_39701:64-942(+)|eukprot:CAMPEP_0169124576 /NCGR_PEP_ID=MMETSP1015-20121227/34400_1 /TAXON_ID=342587 /ORGANISM="Karlodinium micrum, Strain CCMP2283" /LENGTH=292 /DNA_ID=CAMNT_0009188005 /DNA_START=64 /DNA_END=942 /DNA_ORIENTATION=+
MASPGVDVSSPKRQKSHERERGETLILFDVDGTLAVPAQPAKDEMIEVLAELRRKYSVGIVGAGDFQKQQMQLGGPDLRSRLDFVFSENGVHAFEGQKQLHCKSISEHLGEDRWVSFQSALDVILEEESAESERLLRLATGNPDACLASRSIFLEKRQCTVNVCPIGRTPTLSKEQRGTFDTLDREAGLRHRVLQKLDSRFGPETEYGLKFSIGGQIGIDVCPVGWDKTFCLQFVDPSKFDTVHFFGDKTEEGGGDHEIYEHPRTIGHSVQSPEDTIAQIRELFLKDSVDGE